jgi:two-component system OmpR family sensor kinase
MDNLLANAVRFSPAGSPVEVRVGRDGEALVEVADHGPGVPPGDTERVFEPFHRSDRSRTRATGGAGLGLAIVAAITRAHGGSVGVEANDGGGARFWVRLPLPTTGDPELGADPDQGLDGDVDRSTPTTNRTPEDRDGPIGPGNGDPAPSMGDVGANTAPPGSEATKLT